MRLLAAAVLLLAAGPVRAGEAACWFEEGALVVPAVVAGAAGDYILDTGTAQTQLHETRAQAEGFEATRLTGEVRVAGVRLGGRRIVVESLDARTFAFPTPIAGVIGADVLSGFVVDVSFAPCKVALHRPGRAPSWRGGRSLPMGRAGALPLARAAITDGRTGASGPFILAVSQPLPARLNEALATAPGAAKPEELYPGGVGTAELAGLSFAGSVLTQPRAGLMRQSQAEGALGAVGSPVLSRYILRFDFPRGRILLKPAPPVAKAAGEEPP